MASKEKDGEREREVDRGKIVQKWKQIAAAAMETTEPYMGSQTDSRATTDWHHDWSRGLGWHVTDGHHKWSRVLG